MLHNFLMKYLDIPKLPVLYTTLNPHWKARLAIVTRLKKYTWSKGNPDNKSSFWTPESTCSPNHFNSSTLDIFASIQVLCWLCFHSEPCGLEWVYQSRFVAFRVLDQQSHAGMIGIHTRDKLLSLKWDNTPLTIIQVLTAAITQQLQPIYVPLLQWWPPLL